MRAHESGDQAEGLRRLLVGARTRVVTVVAGKAGAGRTSATLNLAATLARAGKDVLVLDENPGPGNLFDRLGLTPRFDLLDVALGRCQPEAVLQQCNGFSLMAGARAMRALNGLDAHAQARLEQALNQLSHGMDVLLVDAAMLIDQATVSSSLASGATLLVVTDASAGGITESYALIKKLALEHACQSFQVVVNRAADEPSALTVFHNMARVARQHLSVQLQFLGYVPRDARLAQATRLARPVTEAFPAALSSFAYTGMSQALMRLPVPAAESGAGAMVRNLLQRIARQSSQKALHVVN